MFDKTCTNHPERAAVENCEVCGVPLCAYCLYYTSDGQRLCKTHADQAEAAGAFIRAPGVYSGGLIGAQASAARSGPTSPAALYEGNTPDVIALIGMVFGALSLVLLVPGLCCLVAPAGLILSVVALLGSRDARNPKRTRRLAGVGMGMSCLGLVVVVACILLLNAYARAAVNGLTVIQVTVQAQFTLMPLTAAPNQPLPTHTPAPIPSPTPPEAATPPLGR